jgi:hypothetical protein
VDTTKDTPNPRTGEAQLLYAAAYAAMLLLRDRQEHTPEEMLDGRERRVLRLLREAIRPES